MDQYMPLVGIPNILPMDASQAAQAGRQDEEKESVYYFATLNANQVCVCRIIWRACVCLGVCMSVCVYDSLVKQDF